MHPIENESHPLQAEVTRLLARCSGGDDEALDRLIPLVYEDLRAIERAGALDSAWRLEGSRCYLPT